MRRASIIPILPVADNGQLLTGNADALDTLDNPRRRHFLGLMAASAALAGAGCSGPPQEVIVPYVEMPEKMTLGRPLFYASAHTRRGIAQGVLIESNMGRPTKIEGNPAHPANLGATDIYAQASVLQLWDPDRSQTPRHAGEIAAWGSFDAALLEQSAAWKADQGKGLRILSGCIGSPTLAAQLQALLEKYPQAQWHRFDPLHDDRAFEAAKLAFGRPADAVYRTDAANLILTLDADLFGDWPGSIAYARGFTGRRSSAATAFTNRSFTNPSFTNRLYAIESTPTITGASADNRLALAPHAIDRFIWQLAADIGMPEIAAAEFDRQTSEPKTAAWRKSLAHQLTAQRGKSLIVAGGAVGTQTRALVHAMNAYLGNVGKTVQYISPVEAEACNHSESIAALSADMHAGKVTALIILSANPIYNAPGDLAFAEALAKVAFSVHLGLYADETGQRATWHLPQAHPYEEWSDGSAFDGTQSIVQPAIAPLYGGRSAHELLARLTEDQARNAYAVVQQYWRQRHGGAGFDTFWKQALQQGVIADTARVSLPLNASRRIAPPPAGQGDTLTIIFAADPSLADGEFGNSGWLHELPRPMTQLTWDNAALIGVETAAALSLQTGDVVNIGDIARPGIVIEAPIMVLAEHAEAAITLPLGYGRWAAGRVGNGIGFSAYPLRGHASWQMPLTASLTKTGRRHSFALAQTETSMEGRDPVPLASAGQFLADPRFATAKPRQQVPDATLYPKWDYKDYKWGMAIDLNACIGCNVCTIACQAENNIPVVGREEVAKGRRMHWIRVDHYRAPSGPAGPARSLFQPVPCMHCENAPCEEVCPVGATVHDSEGLNVQIYNRCVGTRFCSNNCPYKVRRFNFLQYANTSEESLKALQNPEVTVRRRGVMEKCTYCLQRITRARIGAEELSRPLRDGEVVTACQAACPTGAIVFGNLNDPDSAVTRAKASPLNYALLADLNTHPRTTYAARVVNTDSELE
jgi:Fe-S-cluster-containing dehydrogenase component